MSAIQQYNPREPQNARSSRKMNGAHIHTLHQQDPNLAEKRDSAPDGLNSPSRSATLKNQPHPAAPNHPELIMEDQIRRAQDVVSSSSTLLLDLVKQFEQLSPELEVTVG